MDYSCPVVQGARILGSVLPDLSSAGSVIGCVCSRMAITVGIRVEHLAVANVYPGAVAPLGDRSKLILAPNLLYNGSVRSTLKEFVRDNLFFGEEQQQLVAPLFTRLSESMPVEEVYKRYACQADRDECELFVDEESLTFFGREAGKTVDLPDDAKLHEYNILDKSIVELRKAPQLLSGRGGRLFVETKDGILPLQGICGDTRVSALKDAIEKHTGILKSRQLLSSIGCVMHDEFCIKDFDGVHAIYEDSIVDLTVSGDTNNEQAHRRMLVTVNVLGHEEFRLIVQGRDRVQDVTNIVEARTGIPQWQQRISFSGNTLQDKKTLAEYFVCPQSTLQVAAFKSPLKSSFKAGKLFHAASENRDDDPSYTPAARKLKMVRTCKGVVAGTITIPVLTSDTVGDLRRKVKRSLRPLEETNFSIGTPPRNSSASVNCLTGPSPLKPRPANSAHKLPPPPLADTPERFETPRARLPASPQTPQSCYVTPPMSRSKSRSAAAGAGTMESPARGSKSGARRLLKFGGGGGSPQQHHQQRRCSNQVVATDENNGSSVEDKINKALVHIVSSTGVVESAAATDQKKGMGAWLKQIRAALR
ncbi:hypothetical protein SELMODRAFT_410981 [Selaginella moellendorffii]|uniref:Ubiquitin-like domain-containing protein n=1 Tax=Selaginella moellendorffii TaxID=88036 RepID=D8RHM2_SELML|nr:hypothetical protein SELMODRAFT_410981 [Selaginella moellendorffii]